MIDSPIVRLLFGECGVSQFDRRAQVTYLDDIVYVSWPALRVECRRILPGVYLTSSPAYALHITKHCCQFEVSLDVPCGDGQWELKGASSYTLTLYRYRKGRRSVVTQLQLFSDETYWPLPEDHPEFDLPQVFISCKDEDLLVTDSDIVLLLNYLEDEAPVIDDDPIC